MSYKVVHYINQFFANIGGEEMAHVAPELRDGFVGPGMALNTAWKGEAEIVKTIVCGDSYFAEHEADAKKQVLTSLALPPVTTASARGSASARDWLLPSWPAYSSVMMTVLMPCSSIFLQFIMRSVSGLPKQQRKGGNYL